MCDDTSFIQQFYSAAQVELLNGTAINGNKVAHDTSSFLALLSKCYRPIGLIRYKAGSQLDYESKLLLIAIYIYNQFKK